MWGVYTGPLTYTDEDGIQWLWDKTARMWKPDPNYPHKCPCCSGPSYQGIVPGAKIDCKNRCEGSKVWPNKL